MNGVRGRRPRRQKLPVVGKAVTGVQASTAVAHDVKSTAYSDNGGTLTPETLQIEFSRTGKRGF
ncbi:hypothetical protein [Streptomyces sp. H51]|uniref:hypothetical protein n=1 Tax=Streptomyces sp. H51 TaxID=3111770 RepID=UPI002D78EE40|nr:hypothetical protein [Streptomyces sp. H51]